MINLLVFGHFASKITEGVPITSTGTGNTALLVIDIQEGTTGEASAIEAYRDQSDSFIRNVNQIAEVAGEKGWPVIYIKSEVVNPLINMLNSTMARDSEGAELDKRLSLVPGPVITKRKNDSFNKTKLDEILAEKQVEKLVIVGLDAEHCVFSAIQAALNRGYKVAVIADGIIAEEEADKIRMLDTYRELGVEVL